MWSFLAMVLSVLGGLVMRNLGPSLDLQSKGTENGTLLTLCRNSDLYSMLETVQNVEDRFNSRYHYDWVFLNDEPFTEEFKDRISSLVSGEVKFGLVDESHWSLPSWIDQDLMHSEMERMSQRVIYGGSESYRHMCRWFSGFYQWHELVLPYKYAWRVEPGIKYFCDVEYDVFKRMRLDNKKYGFTLSIFEYRATIPTLWQTVLEFLEHEEHLELPQDGLSEFILNESGDYNLCHFWTNFEISDMDVFRSEAYQRYFDYLDRKGGIFYERWGDGPIRSIFVSLFLRKDDILWFDDLGYMHPPYLQCPLDQKSYASKRCSCDPARDFTYNDYSCTRRYLQLVGHDR